jgi:hypothetical protein
MLTNCGDVDQLWSKTTLHLPPATPATSPSYLELSRYHTIQPLPIITSCLDHVALTLVIASSAWLFREACEVV